ncbi:MAG: 50S ribosomal protein L29 [Schleiferiaceae bacterium]|jgi:large subunit ribosomal protein L29|nr:50S ribosomal protein L29 [Schleiferiaceae bacterium]
MKYSEIKELTTQELEERRVEEKMNLAKAKLTHAVSPLENPLSIRESRRNIARINFELRNREIEG